MSKIQKVKLFSDITVEQSASVSGGGGGCNGAVGHDQKSNHTVIVSCSGGGTTTPPPVPTDSRLLPVFDQNSGNLFTV